ncbi:MAG: hypothetical protein IJO93_07260 [Clostridia bacterium]|nr:hypothetical protein [Clostridia bacterium]
MSKQTTIIEIGSSKVVCLVAGKSGSELVIHGIGSCGYSGGYKYDMYRGITEYPDAKELSNALRRAVQQAEHESGMRIVKTVVAVNAPFLKSIVMRGERAGGTRNRYVVEEDEGVLGSISLRNTDRTGYVHIHSTPIVYYLDGVESGDLPIGSRIDDSLAGDFSHVFINEKMANLIDEGLRSIGVERICFLATPLAEARYLIPNYDTDKNAVLIDVGYTHTDVSVIRNEAILSLDVIPIGGKHFSSDIELVTKIPFSNAELIKKRYKFGLDYRGTTETIKNADGVVQYIDKEECSQIIMARMDELCDYILDTIEGRDIDPCSVKVYVTGGGIMMEDCLQYIADRTEMNLVQSYPEISRRQLNTSNNISAFAVASFVIDSGYSISSGVEEEPKKTVWQKIFKK